MQVACHKADTLLVAGEVEAPDVIKIDVEGAEYDFVEGAAEVIQGRRPVIFLAIHEWRVLRGVADCSNPGGIGSSRWTGRI
jgi:hypothetical protein